jgi:nucleoside-diphosphate kinase
MKSEAIKPPRRVRVGGLERLGLLCYSSVLRLDLRVLPGFFFVLAASEGRRNVRASAGPFGLRGREIDGLSERTFVMIKPDGVGRRLAGEVIRRYEAKGLKLIAMKMQIVERSLAEEHYAEHKGKGFYEDLLAFITSGPTIQMVWEGENAVAVARKLNGATNSQEADLGTIRGDFGMTVQNNVVHASDKVETAEREIGLYFKDDEILNYAMPDDRWLGA